MPVTVFSISADRTKPHSGPDAAVSEPLQTFQEKKNGQVPIFFCFTPGLPRYPPAQTGSARRETAQ
jgi:hypothetical protein